MGESIGAPSQRPASAPPSKLPTQPHPPSFQQPHHRPTNPPATQEQMDQLTNSLKSTHTDVHLCSLTQSSFSSFPIIKLCFPNPLAEKEWETDGHGRGFEILGWGWRYCGAVGAGAGDMTITSSSAPFPSLPWRRRAARCR